MKHIFTYMKICYLDNLMKNIGIAILIFLAAYHGDLILQSLNDLLGLRIGLSPYFFIYVFVWTWKEPYQKDTFKNSYFYAQTTNQHFIHRIIYINSYSLMATLICLLVLPFQNIEVTRITSLLFFAYYSIWLVGVYEISDNNKYSKRKDKWTSVDKAVLFFSYFMLFVIGVSIAIGLAYITKFNKYSMMLSIIIVAQIFTFIIYRHIYKSFISRTQYLTN